MLKRENNRALIFFFKKFYFSFSNQLEEKRAASVRNIASSIVKNLFAKIISHKAGSEIIVYE